MKSNRIFKSLAIAALSTMTLLAGASQAEGWGQYQNAYAPYLPDRAEFDRHNFDYHALDTRLPEASYSIDARQMDQMEKIMRGVRSGSLSRLEARKLMQEQSEIEHLQRQYLSDRRLSRNEWLDLDHQLDRAEHAIRAEKHDQNWR